MKFAGFEAKGAQTPVPPAFFSELLPQIDHLGELKVCLYVIWRLHNQEGSYPFCRYEELAADELFLQGLEQTGSSLDEALGRAVNRGVLLSADVPAGKSSTKIYLLNSPGGKAALNGLHQGAWSPEDQPVQTLKLGQKRPNIFQLFESNLGPLTPMLADSLREAEAIYPAEWIEEAIRIAVENNVRKWRYVDAILKSWQEKGRDDRKDQQDTEENRRKYVSGEFSDFIEH